MAGILVSNHGGRQLDSVPATIEVLSNIVKAVGDRAKIYIDGGITQGTNVFKALVLGAEMIFIVRPLIWGLSCGGEQGARSVLEIMRNEIDETFAMAGCSDFNDITKDFVKHELLQAHLELSIDSEQKIFIFQLVKRVTQAEAEATSYLTDHRIGELFTFLMAHLAAEQPDDPIDYLFDLLDKCLLFRSGLVEPPLLFAPRHIESVYDRLDPGGVGHISLSQYVVGMKTLGIDCVDACKCNRDCVDKDTFVREAKSRLVKMLKEMIGDHTCDC